MALRFFVLFSVRVLTFLPTLAVSVHAIALLKSQKETRHAGFSELTPKQFGMCASANKNHAVSIQFVDQQQVTFCMTFPVF